MTFMTILQTQLLWVPAMHLQYSILNAASAAPVGTRTGPENAAGTQTCALSMHVNPFAVFIRHWAQTAWDSITLTRVLEAVNGNWDWTSAIIHDRPDRHCRWQELDSYFRKNKEVVKRRHAHQTLLLRASKDLQCVVMLFRLHTTTFNANLCN